MLVYGAFHPAVRALALTVAGLSKIFITLILTSGRQFLDEQITFSVIVEQRDGHTVRDVSLDQEKMELGPTYFIGELVQALIGGVRLLLVLGIPLSILVSSLAVGAHFRRSPYPAVLRPGFKFLALLQVGGAAIVLFIDIAGLVTAPWQFEYIATSFPEVLVFAVPLGLLTAPLWLLVLRRVEPATFVSLVPHA